MKKILTISTRVPAEGRKGDQVLSFYRLQHLVRTHQIQVICFGHTEDDLAAKRKLELLGITVFMIRWNKIGAALNVLRSLFDAGTPFQCAIFQDGAFKNAVRLSLLEFQPDIVYAVTIRTVGNLVGYKGPLVVDMVDSMALNFKRRVEAARGLKHLILNVEYLRVRSYERLVAKIALCSFVVSRIDQKEIGSDKVFAIPLGIDLKQFCKDPDRQVDLAVIFAGNMNYTPNVEAVLWFYENCWNRLQHELPNIRFIIAGSNPTADLVALGVDRSISVTGRVPSLAAVINQALVSIAPMQSGSGMQFKILEAMACGVPVVATTLGLGDITALDGDDVLLADTPESFTQAVLSLLQSVDMRARVGESGMRYVTQNHSWDRLNEQFERMVNGALV